MLYLAQQAYEAFGLRSAAQPTNCADEHDCGLGSFLPVVNSPRAGVCGFVG